jgi:hypothetical protein
MSEPVNYREFGFFGENSDEWRKSFREHFPVWLTLYEDTVELCYSVAMTGKGELRQGQLLAHILFSRVITSFQGVFILAERGLDAECKTVLRSFAEASFSLAAISKDPTFTERILRNNQYEEQGWFKKWNDLSEGTNPEIVVQIASYTVTKNDKLPIREIADAASMTGFFKAHYSRLCMFGHPSPHSLAARMKIDRERNRVSTDFLPNATEADDNLRLGMILILESLRGYWRLFDKPTPEQWKALNERFNVISSKFDIKDLRPPKA